MKEYPKRLYRGGKGYTVNSLEEEQLFMGTPATVPPPVLVEEEEAPSATDEEKTVEALEYIVSKGYSKTAAKKILKKEGVEAILAAKAEGREPQE